MLKTVMTSSVLVTGLLINISVSAHEAYIAPLGDMPEGKQVLLHAGYSENLFVPEFPLKAKYFSINPQGQQQELTALAGLKSASVVELPLEQQGTYKIFALAEFSTNYAKQNGTWKAVYEMAADEAPAASKRPYLLASEVKGTDQKLSSTAHGKVATYVSKGETSQQVLAVKGQGLEFKFKQHPNQVKQSEGLSFQVLFDGKPVANAGFHVEQAGAIHHEEAEDKPDVSADKNGQVQLAFKQPGQYLIKTSYPENKAGAQPAADVYHYALTIDVK